MFCKLSLILSVIIFASMTASAHPQQVNLAASTQSHEEPLPASQPEPVKGFNNNVTYCTVPRAEQLLRIAFFDISPMPVPVDRLFFTYLRGTLPDNITGLENAKLRFTTTAELASGEDPGVSTIVIPLSTYAVDNVAHITIRLPGGRFGGPLEPGAVEILTDYWFVSIFTDTGMYHFKVEGYIPGSSEEDVDKYLFCMQYSQWLQGAGW